MKLARPFKLILYMLCAALYATGAWQFACARWFPMERGFGPEPSPLSIGLLRAHSSISLAFLIAFGYLIYAHVRPGLRSGKRLKSGLALILAIGVLTATVPGLLYFGDEAWKATAASVHTAVGFAIGAAFALHLAAKVRR